MVKKHLVKDLRRDLVLEEARKVCDAPEEVGVIDVKLPGIREGKYKSTADGLFLPFKEPGPLTYAFAGEVRLRTTELMEEAEASGDLGSWILAHRHRVRAQNPTKSFGWIFEEPKYQDYSWEDYRKDNMGGIHLEKCVKEARVARLMYQGLAELPEKADCIRVAFTRLRHSRVEREETSTDWTYRGLAIFPEGTRLNCDSLFQDEMVTADRPAIMYMVPEAPCIEHSCDRLYKDLDKKQVGRTKEKKTIAVGHIPYIAPQGLVDAVGGEGGSRIEFQDEGGLKNPMVWGIAAFSGFFTNAKPYRIPPKLLN
ncbi:MAG: hypothetical protein ABH851_08570 [Methanobacteriota archaeon]